VKLLRQSLIIFLLFFFSHMALAERTTIIADADLMEKNTPLKTLTLKGNVNVIFQQQHLLCDEAIVYEGTSTIVAQGNVILQSARTTLRGERLEYNYETNKGTLYKGLITSGQVLLEADEIIKIGEDRYSADDAYFTSCITCPPSWGFTSSHIEAEIGGYAYISRPWLHLLQFPVLPLPYLVVPLNSKRQTGLLVPAQGTNPNGGVTLEVPFFWAIDRSHDATFSLINYEKRGLQGNANFRYVMSEESSGELNTSYMKDRVFGLADRWFLQYKHHYALPDHITQRTELALASDSLYPRDFPNQMMYLGQPAFDNRNSLTKAFANSLLTIDTSYYFSLLEPGTDPNFPKLQALNAPSLHRMPEINFHMLDQKISDKYNLFFSMDMQYLNVTSQGPAFSRALSGDTQCAPIPGQPEAQDLCFQAAGESDFNYGSPFGAPLNGSYGDLIRTGQRLDVMPSFHAPFWMGPYLDVNPYLNLRYTQYALGVESDPTQGYSATPSRFYSQFGVSTRSYISKVFDVSEDKSIKHSIIPQFDLSYIPKIHQSDHNFFGSPDSLRYFREQQPLDNADIDWRNGGRGVQFDNRDRVIGKQLAHFAVTNKLMSRSKKDARAGGLASRYNQELIFRVAQAFDINEAGRGADARPWQDIRSDLLFRTGPITQALTTETYPYHNWTNITSSTRYTFEDMSFVQFAYTNFASVALNPPVDRERRGEFGRMSMGLNISFIQLLGSMEYNFNPRAGEPAFVHWSLNSVITPPGKCWALLVGLQQFMGTSDVTHNINMRFEFAD
jgi:LPS-assembly protein